MKTNIFLLSLLAITITSCKDDIDFTYDNVPQKFVVEGTVYDNSAKAIVSKTIDMDNSAKRIPYNAATVTLTGDDGTSIPLVFSANGEYVAAGSFTAKAGTTYTMNVTVEGGETFSSYSTMQKPAPLDSIWFAWNTSVHDEKLLVMHYTFQDVKDEPNYYLYRMYRNGETYKWGVVKDQGYENTHIDKTVMCISKEDMENDDEEDREKMLYDNDVIDVSLLVIDRRTYDYLYSLSISSFNATNAYSNFTNISHSQTAGLTNIPEVLGFFTAASISKKQTVLKLSELKEEK